METSVRLQMTMNVMAVSMMGHGSYESRARLHFCRSFLRVASLTTRTKIRKQLENTSMTDIYIYKR